MFGILSFCSFLSDNIPSPTSCPSPVYTLVNQSENHYQTHYIPTPRSVGSVGYGKFLLLLENAPNVKKLNTLFTVSKANDRRLHREELGW